MVSTPLPELIYPVRSADRLLTTTRLVAQVGFLGVLVGVAAHMGLGPVPTALAAGIAVLAPLWRRPTHVPSVVLRVENGTST